MYRKYKNIICILVSMLTLTGCVTNTEFEQNTDSTDDDKIITTELDTELMNSSHINIWLKDNIEVDADITPLDKYKNGLGTYNLSIVKSGLDYTDEDIYQNEDSYAEGTGIKKAFSEFVGDSILEKGWYGGSYSDTPFYNIDKDDNNNIHNILDVNYIEHV